METIKGLVLAGGGVLGTAHLGAYKMLEEYGYKFDHFVGSSIGAFISTVLACRCPSSKFEEIINNLDYASITGGTNIIYEAIDLERYNGLHSTQNLRKMYAKVIKDITNNENITFNQIYINYGTHLAMTATKRSTESTIYFDRLISPDMPVIDACIFSASVPWLFEADQYIDGGLLNNYPLNYLLKFMPIESIIGLNFFKDDSDCVHQCKPGLIHFTSDILSMLFNQAFKLNLTNIEKKQTIWINTKNIKSFNFNITEKDKQLLFQSGIESVTQSHFNSKNI